jgi:hypothetical protein
MITKLINFIKRLNISTYSLSSFLETEKNNMLSSKILMGKILSRMNSELVISNLDEVEFKVFSQWGDDGIIQYLINKLDIPNKVFIEFGVENYRESNTRFLLINNNWSGCVIDGSEKNIQYIKDDIISWGFELHSYAAFITKNNINGLLENFLNRGYDREIGILSIDIDGNDYWIWKEINTVNPIVVIIEYNCLFGIEKPLTIPYKDDFDRVSAHSSKLYYGTSLLAACELAKEKGYAFIGCNSAGNNAYFIRKDKIGPLKEKSPEEGFVISKFREHNDKLGNRSSGKERVKVIKGLPLLNIRTNEIELIQ